MSRLRPPSIKHAIATISAFTVATVLVISTISSVRGADTVRVTTSFDYKHSAQVLRQVARVLSGGFDRAAADRLADEVKVLPADRRKSWSYTVSYQGGSHALQIQAMVDDLGMVDMDFATDATLAPALRAAVDTYLNR